MAQRRLGAGVPEFRQKFPVLLGAPVVPKAQIWNSKKNLPWTPPPLKPLLITLTHSNKIKQCLLGWLLSPEDVVLGVCSLCVSFHFSTSSWPDPLYHGLITESLPARATPMVSRLAYVPKVLNFLIGYHLSLQGLIIAETAR